MSDNLPTPLENQIWQPEQLTLGDSLDATAPFTDLNHKPEGKYPDAPKSDDFPAEKPSFSGSQVEVLGRDSQFFPDEFERQQDIFWPDAAKERPHFEVQVGAVENPPPVNIAPAAQPAPPPIVIQAYMPQGDEKREKIREGFVPIFTNAQELEAHFAKIAKEYPIGQSKDPQGLMMRAENRNYLRFDTQKPITSDVEYRAEMDKWAVQHGGWPGMDDRQGFGLIARDLRKGVNTKTAVSAVLPAITLGLAQSHGTGEAQPWYQPVQKWMQNNPGLAKNIDERKLLEAAWQHAQRESAMMARYGDKLQPLADALGHTKGQAEPDEVALAAAGSILAGVAPEDRPWVLNTVALMKQSEPPQEGYWATLGQAAQRGAGGMATSVMRNMEQLDLHNRMAYLQHRKDHGIEASETLPMTFDPMLSGGPAAGLDIPLMNPKPTSPYPELDAIPLNKIDAQLADLQEQSKQLDLQRELRAVANGQIDPLRATADGKLGRLQQATYGVAESTPLMLTAAMPGIGTFVAGSTMLSQNYDHVRVKYPDLAPEKALGLAATTTAAQTVLLNLAVGGIIKSLPATSKVLGSVEKVTTGQKIGEVTKNMLVVGGANEFSVAAPSLVEGTAKALGVDLKGYDAEKELEGFKEAQPETFLMMLLPWVAASGGAAVRRIFPRQSEAEHAQILSKLGIPEDRAKAIAAEKDPARQRAMQAEEWAKIPAEVKQQLIREADAKNIEAKQTGQFTEAPSIVKEVGKDEEGQPQDVYHVLHEDGTLAHSTNDIQTADLVRQGLMLDESFLQSLRDPKSSLRRGLDRLKQKFKSPYVKKSLRKEAVFHAFDLAAVDWPTRIVARRSGAAIDLVHTGDDLPLIRVDNEVDHLGEFDGISFRIGIKSEGYWPHMTFLHETGHALSFYILDDTIGDKAATSMIFSEWRKAVDQSRRIKYLRKVLSPDHYLLSYSEIFARSYAQHIAISSKDPIILSELEKIGAKKGYTQRVWNSEDFLHISMQIDRILLYRGLK